MKKKAFTLIELIAVLVILAILALIVTPLVMNIIRKARISADKRSIDAYGRSIDIAIASYLLDNGKFPTSIDELTIEYSGDRVVCETSQLNSDSSVYLAGCTVNGRSVEGYTYGEQESEYDYVIGDSVTYNGDKYYVIKNSKRTDTSVTLLKDEPLTTQQVNTYGGVGTENNYVNLRVTGDTRASYYEKASDIGGYGGMAYYTDTSHENNSDCGYSGNVSGWRDYGCKSSYTTSHVKHVVDAWAADKLTASDLVEDETGYSVRLITYDELKNNLGEIVQGTTPSGTYDKLELKYDWVYNSDYWYWTMSPSQDSEKTVVIVLNSDTVNYNLTYRDNEDMGVVRPVITIKKSAL